MSYILYGIVIPDSEEGARETRESLRLAMDVIPLSDKCTLLANRSRHQPYLSNEALSSLMSRYGRALSIHWDDQKEIRKAKFFVKGKKPLEFSEHDELYVELHDDGYPDRTGKRYTLSEVERCTDEKEFETCTNAIELGCEASGLCKAELLMKFIREQV